MNQIVHKRRLVFGSIIFALMFFYLGVNSYFTLVEVGSYTGWNGYSNDGRHFYTSHTDPDGPTAALQAGDEILAINGVNPGQDFSILEIFDRSPVATPFTFTVNRDGQVFLFQSRTTAFPPGKYPYQSKGRRGLLANWVLFLAVGLIVLLLKSDNRQAWLLALMLGTFVGTMTNYYPYSVLGAVVETLVAIAKIVTLWFFPIFPLFFLNFPERSPLLQRLPRLESWIYWSMYVLLLPYWLANRLPSYLKTGYINLPGLRSWLDFGGKYNLPVVVITAYLAAGFFFMIVSYRSASVDSRKRMRVAMLGSSVGFFALFLLILNNFGWANKVPGWAVMMGWVETILFFTLPLIPLSFAYAIIRYKVIPISLIIRRGVRYLLVSHGSILLEIALLSLLLWIVMDKFFDWLQPLSGRVVGTISAVVAVVAWQVFRWFHLRYLAPIIDRRFFRESYDAQQILTELAQSVRTTTSVRQLLELIAERIQKALHSENVTIFLREPGAGWLKSEVSSDYLAASKQTMAVSGSFVLPADSPLVGRLATSAEPVSLNGDRPIFKPEEDAVWQSLKTELLLPLTSKEELLGAISLGPRAGDLPYSREDESMLMNVAVQTALAIENTRLIERTIQQERRRQELEAENEQRAKELEEARQLQLSMLPKKVPQLPHLDIAAYMKTATEVGGDYYDFHLAQDGTLTLVIGDATGHGLKAGTMVTATKSLFNELSEEPNLPVLLARISRALKQMNLRSLFMALTVARIRGNSLTISAAGMPSALIVRAAAGAIEEVSIKAMPLGSITNYAYSQREVSLTSGDVVVLMSDGLPERFNEQGEMLDYQQVYDTLLAVSQQSSQYIIDRLVQVGDAWGGTRIQDDDVTFVVLKVA